MFTTTRAYSSFAVPDIDAARAFYGDTLGIRTSEVEPMGLLRLHLAGDRDTLVYPKPDHQPANFTILNFAVDDLDGTVDELASRGIDMQRYEGFDQDDKGIARQAGGPAIAWFTDPAGNIIGVHEQT